MAAYAWSLRICEEHTPPAVDYTAAAMFPKRYGGSGASGLNVPASLAQTVFLFDKNIRASARISAIALLDHGTVGTESPAVVGPSVVVSQQERQAVWLVFDQAVQSGEGNFELRDHSTDNVYKTIPASSAEYFQNIVILPTMMASNRLTTAFKYYVSSTVTAVKGISGVALTTGFSTKASVTFSAVADAADTTAPDIIVTTLQGYNCVPAFLDSFNVYFTEPVTPQAALLSITDCGVDGDCGITGDNSVLWSTNADGANAALDSVLVNKLTATVQAQMARGHKHRLTVAAGAVKDVNAQTMAADKHVDFRVCRAVVVEPTGTNKYITLLHEPLNMGIGMKARKYEVVLPANAVTDSKGNQNAAETGFAFLSDKDPPIVDGGLSSPPSGNMKASIYENLVLAFNEDVKSSGCGTTQFQVWACGNDGVCGAASNDDIQLGGVACTAAVISQNKLFISPKRMAGTDLEPEKVYYVRSSAASALFDMVGNPLPALDTGTSWYFQTVGTSADDRAPAVVATDPHHGDCGLWGGLYL
jgi:hypothetical protein